MAGQGNRFALAGYKDPKPFIPIFGMPMIQLVIQNLTPSTPHRFIFICQQSHVESYAFKNQLKTWAAGAEIVLTDQMTEGAACSVLLAKKLIDNSDSLMIANSDQYILTNINDYLMQMHTRQLHGLIMTMHATDPKWSYTSVDEEGYVNSVVEKKVISPFATVGIYNFLRGSDFIQAAEKMIKLDARSNGEFYVAPTYNFLDKKMKIGIHNIGNESVDMYGLGTPPDLESFKKLPFAEDLVRGRV